MSLRVRFQKYVGRRSLKGCLPWSGCVNPAGYGMLRVQGVTRLAHRIAWRLAKGHWPKGCVLHKCDVPRCVNVAHLWLGSRADNLADMRAKGRGSPPPVRCGEANNKAKLTKKQVRKIREIALTVSHEAVGRLYGVTGRTINYIRKGVTW